jgi:hypothetical protein
MVTWATVATTRGIIRYLLHLGGVNDFRFHVIDMRLDRPSSSRWVQCGLASVVLSRGNETSL